MDTAENAPADAGSGAIGPSGSATVTLTLDDLRAIVAAEVAAAMAAPAKARLDAQLRPAAAGK